MTDKQQKAPIVVGGDIQRSASSPFMMASEVVVRPSTDLADRDIYAVPGAKCPRTGKPLFGLHRSALDEIMDAAGLLIEDSGPVAGEAIEPNVRTWRVMGKREHIDGFQQSMPASYTLDLRTPRDFDPAREDNHGSGRYAELYAGYYDDALYSEAKVLKIDTAGSAGKRATALIRVEEEKGEEWIVRQRKIAHRRAVREVSRMRPHITRRAETGAIHALIRNMLGVKHAYTLDELEAGIMLRRAQRNYDALDMLPEQVKIRVLTTQVLQAYDLDPDTFLALQAGSADQAPEEEPPLEEMEPGQVDILGPEVDAEPVVEDPSESEIIEGEVVHPEDEAVATEAPEVDPRSDAIYTTLIDKIGELDDDVPLKEGIHRAAVQEAYKAAGLPNPDWRKTLTAGQAIKKVVAELSVDEKTPVAEETEPEIVLP